MGGVSSIIRPALVHPYCTTMHLSTATCRSSSSMHPCTYHPRRMPTLFSAVVCGSSIMRPDSSCLHSHDHRFLFQHLHGSSPSPRTCETVHLSGSQLSDSSCLHLHEHAFLLQHLHGSRTPPQSHAPVKLCICLDHNCLPCPILCASAGGIHSTALAQLHVCLSARLTHRHPDRPYALMPL